MTFWFHLFDKSQGKHPDCHHLPWPGTTVPSVWVILRRDILVRSTELTSHQQLEKFKKSQMEMPQVPPPLRILLLAEQRLRHQEGPGVRMTGQRKRGNESHHQKAQAFEPVAERVFWVLLPAALLPCAPAQWSPLLFQLCVSLDSSSPHVRQESTLRPWKGSPFISMNNAGFLIYPLWKLWYSSIYSGI